MVKRLPECAPDHGTAANNQIPASQYSFSVVRAGYTGFGQSTDDFLNHLLDKLRTEHSDTLGTDFGSEFADLTGTTWYGPAQTWPSDPTNTPWITFWRGLDTDINGRMGPAALGDEFWSTYQTGAISDAVYLTVSTRSESAQLAGSDQRGTARPQAALGDVGSIEK